MATSMIFRAFLNWKKSSTVTQMTFSSVSAFLKMGRYPSAMGVGLGAYPTLGFRVGSGVGVGSWVGSSVSRISGVGSGVAVAWGLFATLSLPPFAPWTISTTINITTAAAAAKSSAGRI